jgi:hypothetical protein
MSRPKTKHRERAPRCEMLVVEENGAAAIYIVFDGVRIAKRGHPDSPQARTWTSLEPGFQVLDGKQFPDGGGEIFVYRDGITIN